MNDIDPEAIRAELDAARIVRKRHEEDLRRLREAGAPAVMTAAEERLIAAILSREECMECRIRQLESTGSRNTGKNTE